MNANDILASANIGEDKDWEFKSAKGGLPAALWETYSTMANTDGGVIVLGIKETDGDFDVLGLDDPTKTLKDFWTTVNNRGKVSANLLSNSDVEVVPVNGKPVLVVRIPRAFRRQRPVFVGLNPLEGTYRRYNDGDHLCNREEVGRMLADQADLPADVQILSHFGIADLDKRSLDEYRNRFSSRSPAHPWLKLDDRELLEKLGGWRKDRTTGEEGLTVAGLLMFGRDEAIRDPEAVPQYQVDYRERLSENPKVRWTDRIWPDGTWVANLFQLFERVYPRLVVDLKIPFRLSSQPSGQPGGTLQRHDETIVHEAIREAFVNALIHADFRGQGGIIIERYRDRLEFSNPGTLLVGIEQMLKGGVSECRNKTLQSMFAMLGYGEKAGSGIDKIRQGWAAQKWRWPLIEEQHNPDRVRLSLPMVSLLPDGSVSQLRKVLGPSFDELSGQEVQTLVTAEIEGSVTNLRLQQFSADHTTDITRMLQGLVGRGYLLKDGYGRWASYRLADDLVRSGGSEGEGPDIAAADSGHKEAGPDIAAADSGRTAPDIESDPALLAIAEPARRQKRLEPEQMRSVIRLLCKDRFLTFRQLAVLLNREPNGLQRWTLRPMAQADELVMAFPDKPNHPKQAYKTNPDWTAGTTHNKPSKTA